MSKADYFVTDLELKQKSSEDILSGSLESDIRERIDKIIKTEAPIYSSLIIKRVLNSYGLRKCGSRIASYLNPIIETLPYPHYKEKDELVFFPKTIDCTLYRPCSEDIRYSYQIPYIEGAEAISEIMKEKKMNKKALLGEFALRFGYKRKGAQVVTFFNGSYDYYKGKNK